MSRFKHATPKLPAELLDRLGSSSGGGSTGNRKGKGSGPGGRKEKRKALRAEKKSQRSQPRSFSSGANRPRAQNLNQSEENEQNPPPQSRRKKQAASAFPEPAPKSILKKKGQKFEAPEDDSSPSPPPPIRKTRAIKEKLAEDDAEIAALEKRLGLKGKKKLPKSFEDDGLDDLLEGLDEDLDGISNKRKRLDYEDYLSRKRRNVGGEDSDSNRDSSDVGDAFDSEGDDDELLEDEAGSEDSTEIEEDEEIEGTGKYDEDEDLGNPFSESDSDASEDEQLPRVRENPYLPGVSASTPPSPAVAKYVPPSMRGPPSSDQEAMTRLRRQLQGLLNKLSEANLLTILRDVEGVYNSNPRQHVTSILIDILMGLVCDRTSLMDTFIILHAGFIAAVYKVIGPHFGAQILERIVSEFDKYYQLEKSSGNGNKEASNLIALLAEMYTFQIVGSRLAFDYIRIFLTELSDLNTELLLKIVKNCGPQLRHDDPSALKDIVILLQKQVKAVGEANLPVRTKFMIETINNLKNNRQKTGLVASTMAAEHTTSMKKTLGTLSNRSTQSSEPLGIGLEDIRGSKKEGKWWLVGASWRNETTATNDDDDDDDEEILEPLHNSISTTTKATKHDDTPQAQEMNDLTLLAKQQRMNTSIRRSIFLTIVSATDYKHAHTLLTKLKLKKAQELEIPRVLIHCAGAEQVYNPYYTLIAKRLCREHRFKWAFQYGLWNVLGRMGEKRGEGEDEEEQEEGGDGDEEVGLRMIVNLGRLFGELIGDGGMSITSLKTLNFTHLQPKTKSFLEILLLTTLKTASKLSKKTKSSTNTNIDARTSPADSSTSTISAIFAKAKETPQVLTGLQYFLAKEIDLADFAESTKEKKTLKEGLKVARGTINLLVSEVGVQD